jgi:hypothetical protein
LIVRLGLLVGETEFVKRLDGQQVGVVDDGDDGLAFGVLSAGLGNEA